MNCCLNPYEIPINGAWLVENNTMNSIYAGRLVTLATISMRLNNIWQYKERTSLCANCREYLDNGEKLLKLQLKAILRD
jgi:hypothetical protein